MLSRRAHAAEISAAVAQWRRAIAIRCEFAPWRTSALIGEKGRAGEGDQRATTERGRDKRPQCAAWSVGCCCFIFLLTRQCVVSARNVRLTINSLRGFCFSHIAEAVNG
ncbi:hypothetical protein ACVI1J_005809 [Bradyrhizobium diazoefficiens]|jgi:hypothetical protein|uniref:hypothetical protein n=1 Tax=Bradyrhizobium TaxID=374 RepID=UPI001013D434|nr:hypothetical protein [Bradyrhizobium diazoefficiens]MBR0867329.1 hypothetical protein [Bradyrhizobium diazoefficiens]MBR0891838.1 hypothetical protein [Bradyrhizobium diazoefficiens]MBR0923562.1 hypothetical protein [Bradyrhizobium diazoefficiens]